MRLGELKSEIQTNIFTFADVSKHFSSEQVHDIRVQLSRFGKKKEIYSLKRGIYCFDPLTINEFELANVLYRPSYVSLETALHFYGIIPDVPQITTSVNPTTSRDFKTKYGIFTYHQIKQSLFWGYKNEFLEKTKSYFLIAEPEKALLDYFYLRNIRVTDDLRLDLSEIDFDKYTKYSISYPTWVEEVKLKNE